jgi:hypothetical protein
MARKGEVARVAAKVANRRSSVRKMEIGKSVAGDRIRLLRKPWKRNRNLWQKLKAR